MNASESASPRRFKAFLKLGLTAFGSPIAHIGFFRDEFVSRRKWFDENTFAQLLAVCQFLPGPASSITGHTRFNATIHFHFIKAKSARFQAYSQF